MSARFVARGGSSVLKINQFIKRSFIKTREARERRKNQNLNARNVLKYSAKDLKEIAT